MCWTPCFKLKTKKKQNLKGEGGRGRGGRVPEERGREPRTHWAAWHCRRLRRRHPDGSAVAEEEETTVVSASRLNCSMNCPCDFSPQSKGSLLGSNVELVCDWSSLCELGSYKRALRSVPIPHTSQLTDFIKYYYLKKKDIFFTNISNLNLKREPASFQGENRRNLLLSLWF